MNVEDHHIDRIHRIGKPRSMANITRSGYRPVIVKFISYVQRNLVFTNKKNLKGSNMGITESLTKNRLKLLNNAKEKFNKNSVWTWDGKIVVLVNKSKHYISTHQELNQLNIQPSARVVEPKNLRNRNRSK